MARKISKYVGIAVGHLKAEVERATQDLSSEEYQMVIEELEVYLSVCKEENAEDMARDRAKR